MNTIHGTWNDSPDAVTLIDAHHHLWDLSRKKHPNLIGEPRHDFFMGDDSALRRDYLPLDYKRDADRHNVLTTVHCEAEWDRGDQIGETRWITQINAEYGFPGAIVAHAGSIPITPRKSSRRRLRFRWCAASAQSRSPRPLRTA